VAAGDQGNQADVQEEQGLSARSDSFPTVNPCPGLNRIEEYVGKMNGSRDPGDCANSRLAKSAGWTSEGGSNPIIGYLFQSPARQSR